MAPTFDLANRAFLRIQMIVQEHLPHRIIEMHERERWFTIRNMSGGISEVRAKSSDRPVTLLGEAIDWLVVDEATKISEDVWQSYLSPRLLDRDGWALLISTPRGPGWFYRAFRKGQKRRTPSFESWSAPSWQNPHLPADVLEAERLRLAPDAYAQEYGGQFIGVDLENCDLCKGPLESAIGHAIVWDKEELPRCGECGQPINATTKMSVVKRMRGGQGMFSEIRLFPKPGADPEWPYSVQAIIDKKDAEPDRDPLYGPDPEEDEGNVDDGVELEHVGGMVIYEAEAEELEE